MTTIEKLAGLTEDISPTKVKSLEEGDTNSARNYKTPKNSKLYNLTDVNSSKITRSSIKNGEGSAKVENIKKHPLKK